MLKSKRFRACTSGLRPETERSIMKLPATAFCVLVLGVVLCGCRSQKSETKIYRDDPGADTVIIEKNHSGHHYYDGHWYADPEHTVIIKE